MSVNCLKQQEIEMMKTYMVHELMRYPAIVLQDVEVRRAGCGGDLLCDGLRWVLG